MISWHAREPVLSIDSHKSGRIATAGADNFVRIWELGGDAEPELKCLASLQYHNSSVNIVRFSPDGQMLASAGDDGMIFLYRRSQGPDESVGFGQEQEDNLEHWKRVKTLRGHLADVNSICWSPDSQEIFSGSVDRKTIAWNVGKGKPIQYFEDHNGYVQGVAWDPLSRFVVSQSADRTCRAYSKKKRGKKKVSSKFTIEAVINRRLQEIIEPQTSTSDAKKTEKEPPVSSRSTTDGSGGGAPAVAATGAAAASGGVEAAAAPAASPTKTEKKHAKTQGMFLDETVPTFFRRLAFSPDGALLLIPTARYQGVASNRGDDPPPSRNVLFAFRREELKKPVMYFPFEFPTCAVRFSPVVYRLRQGQPSWTDSPYRMVFAVASLKRVAFFDTQGRVPFAIVENVHYAAITDIAWSADGTTCFLSSQDGYCTIVSFETGQMGTPLPKDEYEKEFKRVIAAAKLQKNEMTTPTKDKQQKQRQDHHQQQQQQQQQQTQQMQTQQMQTQEMQTQQTQQMQTQQADAKTGSATKNKTHPVEATGPPAKKARRVIAPTLLTNVDTTTGALDTDKTNKTPAETTADPKPTTEAAETSTGVAEEQARAPRRIVPLVITSDATAAPEPSKEAGNGEGASQGNVKRRKIVPTVVLEDTAGSLPC